MGAHVASWTLTRGPIPDGLWVLHRCDVKLCVRPDHLFLGAAVDNNHDMIEKGRTWWQTNREYVSALLSNPRPSVTYNAGETNALAKLTDDAVKEIRKRYAAGETNKAALSREYGVSDSLIRVVVNRKAWRHVPDQ
jgi:HNH endonuclease